MARGRNLHQAPGPVQLPFFGVPGGFTASPAEYLLDLAQRYGDVSSFRVGGHRLCLVNRPDLVEEILESSQGSFGLALNDAPEQLINAESLLMGEEVAPLDARGAQTIVDCAAIELEAWRDGEQRDISASMRRITAAAVSKIVSSGDVDAEAVGLTGLAETLLNSAQPSRRSFADRLTTTPTRRAERARRDFIGVVEGIMAERRLRGSGDDLLGVLLRGGEGERRRFSDTRLQDELLAALVAGIESAARVLSATWVQLAQDQEIEARLHSEVDAVVGNRMPCFDDLRRLEYVEQVLAEALRLDPPIWAISRVSRTQYRLFHYVLKPGAICILSPYTMHRHPRYFPEPLRFDPDRFTPEAIASRPRYSFFPFAGGRQRFVGEQLVWTEAVLVMATVAREWRLHAAGAGASGMRVERRRRGLAL